mmetsp:Transcript_10215/g.29159  ORF Transcript_10215/g.29159 Transcript_10215/m.29159 type:complete len:383 (-) Transcript_10215:817-1965(-)
MRHGRTTPARPSPSSAPRSMAYFCTRSAASFAWDSPRTQKDSGGGGDAEEEASVETGGSWGPVPPDAASSFTWRMSRQRTSSDRRSSVFWSLARTSAMVSAWMAAHISRGILFVLGGRVPGAWNAASHRDTLRPDSFSTPEPSTSPSSGSRDRCSRYAEGSSRTPAASQSRPHSFEFNLPSASTSESWKISRSTASKGPVGDGSAGGSFSTATGAAADSTPASCPSPGLGSASAVDPRPGSASATSTPLTTAGRRSASSKRGCSSSWASVSSSSSTTDCLASLSSSPFCSTWAWSARVGSTLPWPASAPAASGSSPTPRAGVPGPPSGSAGGKGKRLVLVACAAGGGEPLFGSPPRLCCPTPPSRWRSSCASSITSSAEGAK